MPTDEPPEKLDAAILFAPAGELVPVAMAALDRGGTLAVAGIHLTDIPGLQYQTHLFQERQLRSVTANTRRDGEELLRSRRRSRFDPPSCRIHSNRPTVRSPIWPTTTDRGRGARPIELTAGMHAFLLSFGVIFVAELGDKSQLMALAFAARYRAVADPDRHHDRDRARCMRCR